MAREDILSKIRKNIWLSMFAWSILSASKLKTITIREGTQAGESILNLRSAFSYDGTTERHFRLQKESEVIEVSDSGDVTIKTILDREELCGQDEICEFETTVAVLPQNVYEKIVLKILIDDVNDNAPRFQESIISLSIPENPGKNYRISVPELQAADEDIGLNGKITYRILPEGQFDLVDEDFRTFLIPLRPFDREIESFWHGSVTARDGGGREARTELQIEIEDENDNKPRFTASRFETEVQEGQAAGAFVYQVLATDNDEGENAVINYTILRVTPGNAAKLFKIDSDTGYISTTGLIDRESFDRVSIIVDAIDGGSPPLSSSCEVTVRITDKNDHAPEIQLTPVYEETNESGTFAVVTENAEAGTFVAFATFEDDDYGVNSILDIEVSPLKLFSIGKNGEGDYIITTNVEFDREEKEFYDMTVIACDSGRPKLCSNVTQQIKIGDENDNNPVMTHKFRQISIPENVEKATIVAKIEAHDADSSENFGLLTFSMVGSEDFEIDSRTGDITVSGVIDYEEQEEFNITVSATDGGGKIDVSNVQIKILNINDNNPVVEIEEVIYIQSGIEIGDVVAVFNVYDEDGTTPILSLNGKDMEKFTIKDNQLLLAQNFTRDFYAEIFLSVTDSEDSSMISNIPITIKVARNFAAIGAGIACGVLFILLCTVVVIFKFCMTHRYKLGEQFNSLRRNGLTKVEKVISDGKTRSDYSRSDLIISDETGKLMPGRSTRSASDASISNMSHPVSVIPNSQKSIHKRGDTDSGHGESESETHSRNHHNSIVMGDWCQPECLTLGHSDSCWLPQMPKKHFEVEVTRSQQCQASSLSVWDRTSDYSSHTAGSSSGNENSSKSKFNRSPMDLPLISNKTEINSKPCFV